MIAEKQIPVKIHQNSVDSLREKHCRYDLFDQLELTTFSNETFLFNCFEITPLKLSHHPDCHTCGFVIRLKIAKRWRKIIIASDFNDPNPLISHLPDADLVFTESNHDLELLERNFNPNSRFHMSNTDTACMLAEARKKSKNFPKNIILGHLSEKRNRPPIAIKETASAFHNAGLEIDFNLTAAPASVPGPKIPIE